MPVDGDQLHVHQGDRHLYSEARAALSIPTTTSITSGFSDVEIGGASPAGGASYSGGTWKVQGGGNDIWGTKRQLPLHLQAITGDCAIIAKVESVQNTHLSARAGVMMRTSLSQGAPRAWMAVTTEANLEQNIQGLAVYGGTNYANKSYRQIPSPRIG